MKTANFSRFHPTKSESSSTRDKSQSLLFKFNLSTSMPLSNFIPFRRTENPFVQWPPAPQPKGLRSRTLDGLSPAVIAGSENEIENVYPPTILLAIGKTGEQTLRLLAEKIAQNGASGSSSVRALLISDSAISNFPANGRQIRILELQQPGTLYIPKNETQSARANSSILFQQVVNYKRYQEWLQENLLDLGNGVQVFLVGSLADPMVGLIGDVLQILRNFPQNLGRANLFSRVCAFLSIRSVSAASLPDEERFAAVREIARFTFNGPHRMNAAFGHSNMVENALLDYLFLLEGNLPASVSRQGEIESDQMLAETLFALMHPSAATLWENLLNDLRFSASIREESHQAVIHSAGVATIYIPIEPIRRYLSARLAYAALFGERKSKPEELLSSNDFVEQPELARIQARRWFLQGSMTHPVFDWFLGLSTSSDFDQIPDLDLGFDNLFLFQLVHSLYLSLNQNSANLLLCAQSLNWIDSHLANCQAWLMENKLGRSEQGARLRARFDSWRRSAQSLASQLKTWHETLFSVAQNVPAAREPGSSDWRNWRVAGNTSWRDPSSQDTSARQASGSLMLWLKQYRVEAEMALSAASSNRIYRSAIATDNDGNLTEVEKYYADTVRPELSNLDREPCSAFNRIRQRLEWWIRITEEQFAQIFLVCWPASSLGGDLPPESYCFRPDQKQALAESILQLAVSQTHSLETDLTTNWFNRRVQTQADFLRRAEDAYIAYDHNEAANYGHAATRRSYLISSDKPLSLALLSDVFPETPKFALNPLEKGSPTRFTALTLRMNIPMDAVLKLKQFCSIYSQNAPELLHLYAQERAAASYEKQLWRLRRESLSILPEMAILLAEPPLVSLFFQSLFTGLIATARDEFTGEIFWQVKALPVEAHPETTPEFSPLLLAPANKNGLLLSLRRFALDLPNAVDANHNPQYHFHPGRRNRYVTLLASQVRAILFTSQAIQVRQSLEPELKSWQQQALTDPLARAFYGILECEKDEPLWLKW